jgi:predicted nucleic acid-binding Zn ribbon protein
MVYCRFCGNEINAEAAKCDKCGEMYVIAPQQSSSFGRTILLIIVVSITLMFVLGFLMNLIVKM